METTDTNDAAFVALDSEFRSDYCWLRLAYITARRSICERKKVGCVITSTQLEITGTLNPKPQKRYVACCNNPPYTFTTFCPGEENCKIEKPSGWSGCVRTIHAEIRCIIIAGQKEIDISQGTAYCTTKPCLECAKALIQAGVSRCVYVEVNEGIPEKFQDLVSFLRFERVNEETLVKLQERYGDFHV